MSTRERTDPEALGKGAQEACREISSEADNIKAQWDGAKGVASTIASVFPWGAAANMVGNLTAQNKVKDTVKNTLNIDMSSNDVIEVSNMCSNVAETSQKNIIKGVNDCEFCMKNPTMCMVANVTQENRAENVQKCVSQAIIDQLRKKEASVSSEAAIKVLQEASGLLTKNDTDSSSCNFVNQDLSSNDYLSSIQKCENQSKIIQTNEIDGCGAFMNIIQRNEAKNLQDCLAGAGVITKKDDKIEADVTSTTEVEQSASGLTPAMIFGSLCISCIVISVIYFVYQQMQENA